MLCDTMKMRLVTYKHTLINAARPKISIILSPVRTEIEMLIRLGDLDIRFLMGRFDAHYNRKKHQKPRPKYCVTR